MRALPGRGSRTPIEDPAAVTRRGIEDDQRQRIMYATGALVAKRGYNDVSVELIVKRAHVSFRTFYKLFPNKEECFLALFDSITGEGRAEIVAAIAANPEAPWPQKVVLAMRGLFGVILRDPIVARALIVEAPSAGPAIIERYGETMKALSPLLRQGRELNPKAARLPSTVEDTLAGGVLWSAYERLIVGEVDEVEALMPEAIEFVLRPYLGGEEAARWARWSQETTSDPAPAVR